MDKPKIDLRAELPYRVEYSKSNRASCRGCKSQIEKDVIRLAKMVKNFKFDGVSPHWYHFDCFFSKIKPKSTGDIAHFSDIRYEDQKRIQEILKDTKCSLDKFTIEYAKSSRSACSLCELKINKLEIRIAKMDDESDVAFQLGRPIPRWFHVDCFAKSREDLDFTDSGDSLPNFSSLESEDQALIKKKIPALTKKRKGDDTKHEIEAKKSRKESKSEDQTSKKLKKQSDLLYKAIDFLKTLKKNELANLAEENAIVLSNDSTKNYDMLADAIVFGALKPCSKCGGQMRFRIAGYICLGHIDEWTPCTYETKNPERKPFVIPEELQSTKFFSSYKFVERKRIYPEIQTQVSATTINSLFTSPSTSNENEKKDELTKPLLGHSISIIGSMKSNSSLKLKIKNLGGKVANMDRTTLFAIIEKNEIESEKYNSKVSEAEKLGIVLVSESVLKNLKSKMNQADVPSIIMKHSLRDWGINVKSKYVNLLNTGKLKSFKSGSKSGKSIPEKQVVTVKGGDAVDSRSGLENNAHVYKDGATLYSVTLNKVDLVKNKNSYYKLQLLQSDYDGSTFWIFSAWGRTGTTIGDSNLKEFRTVENAITYFQDKYANLTGNNWSDRNNFIKKPGHYYPMDISYDELKINKLEVGHSKLPIQIQKIMCMIFDLELMKKELKSFELDLTKMPLGKISKKQISSAYSVLTEIGDLLDSKDKNKLLNCCNKFYTLIPHRFDNDKMKVLTTKDEISEKINMLNTMQDIEIAYEMINSVNQGSFEDPILAHYQELGIVLEILEDPTDFELIQKYVENTHAPTHPIKLHIEDIFKISRNKEEELYKPFEKSNNRMLLWHGSRCSNFAGIFSQGLRIAPPSAPVTGYMFGKGVYFADMVTKSANYCYHSINDNYGLLLLCEVALGNMLELKDANYIKKLPKGKESVKGLGMREPDRTQDVVMKDGVIVPCGKSIPNKIESSLLYNEYVVYDVKRIKLRYLIKVKVEDKL